MNIAAVSYGVTGGYSTDGGDWGLKDGTQFDSDKDEFYLQIPQMNIKNI